ncbi:MAG: beta-galactosidase [Phycisphaerales bacterium]|jgi:beta-galactosidase
MASITFDGRSLLLDGRRIWVMSGSMHFQRVPRESWADRLWRLKLAGMNAVETPVFWNACESRPGVLEFTEQNDIKAFCREAQAAGLWVIVRMGPYIGSGWDLGGLPAWLVRKCEMQETVAIPRSNAPVFLEAAGKWTTALARQIKEMQVTSGGPVLMVQTESKWTCGEEELARTYLGELTRYQREAGINVPRVNTNNLWAGVEGDIDGWAGDRHMMGISRQLTIVKPRQPRFIGEFGVSSRAVYGVEPEAPADPIDLQRRLVEAMAGGAQMNIAPFVGGSSPGFWAGRASLGDNTFIAPVQDLSAPVDEAGRATVSYGPLSRVARFASGFSRLLSHLEVDRSPVVVDPEGGATGGWSVSHTTGTEGSAAFLFSADGKPRKSSVRLLLSDGTTLDVATGKQSAYWFVFDYNLSSRSVLNATSLSPLGYRNDLLVVFGPGGAEGHVVINGTPLFVNVPKGSKPLIEMHEGCVVVVVSEDAVDQTHFTDTGVWVGVDGVDREGNPWSFGGGTTATWIAIDGTTKAKRLARVDGDPVPKSKKESLENWEMASAQPQTDGTSPRFASVPGPADLAELGTPQGYGWYRVTQRVGATKKLKLAAPDSGDRLHLYIDGEYSGLIGKGPGASPELAVSLKKGDRTLVVLADNMGRVGGGSDLRDPKGLTGHLFDVTPFKPGRMAVEIGEPLNLLEFRKPLFWTRRGETTHPNRVSWAFSHRKKSNVRLTLPGMEQRYVVIVNDQPVAFADAGRGLDMVLSEDKGLKRGNNTVQVAFAFSAYLDPEESEVVVKEMASKLNHGAVWTELVTAVTEKGDWSFAKWEPPAEAFYDDVAKSKLGDVHGPTWWKSRFDAAIRRDAPVYLELSGMTKGQVFLNGMNLGRYFFATPDGNPVPPVTRVLLPQAYLGQQGNELVLFDEHGGNPGKLRVVYDG